MAAPQSPLRCIALLRGINVGTAKRVAMADLRKLVEKLGFTDVATLLNSGNVVFTAASAAEARGAAGRIEKAIERSFGFSSRVTVLTAAQLNRVLTANEILKRSTNPSLMLAAILTPAADRPAISALLGRKWAPEAISLGSLALYMWCPNGIAHSPMVLAVNKALRDEATSRNWATLEKLAALLRD